MSAAYDALIASGEGWLKQAQDTYTGGGGVQTAAAEAAIAQAMFLRALLDKPDTLALAMQQHQLRAAMAAQQQRAAGSQEYEQVATDDLSG